MLLAATAAVSAVSAANALPEKQELKAEIDKVLADKEIGILLLTEKFGKEFPDIIDHIRLERKLPLIVEIPDRHGTGRAPDFITSYVNEAIGINI